MTDIRRRNKAGLNHVAHEKVANSLSIFAVSLISLLRLGVLGMGKRYPATAFQDVEYRNPILSGRFHADICASILSEPVNQIMQALGKRRKSGLLVFCATVGVGNPNTSINPSLVYVEATTVFTKNLKCHFEPPQL